MTLDARRLMHLGCACRRAGAAFAVKASRIAREILRGERPDGEAVDESAQSALDLEASAQVLQALSQDAPLLALLPHREKFGKLLRIAEAMDRGFDFVPVEAVSPASVVVVPEHDPAARRTSLRQRVGQGLARLKQRAA